MRLIRLGDQCPDGNTCPALFATDEGTVVVQGRILADDTLGMLRLGDDETAVEIPIRLLREAAQRC